MARETRISGKRAFLWLTLALFVFMLFEYGLKTPTPPARAATADLHGWAWSSNIGWISFNCADPEAISSGADCALRPYQVKLDSSTGDLSEYAWSSSIGAIRFDPGPDSILYGANGYPSSPYIPAKVNLSTGAVTGWARACTVFQTGCSGSLKGDSDRGGWDGFIEMSGTNHASPDATASGGVTFVVASQTFVGNAWGSTNLGWIKFTNVTLTGLGSPPEISMSQHSLTVGLLHDHQGVSVSDADSNLASYAWSWVECKDGSGAVITCPTLSGNVSGALPNGVSASAVPPTSPPGLQYTPVSVGTYKLQLVVTDQTGLSDTETVTETASPPGTFTLSHDPYADGASVPGGTITHPHFLRDIAIRFNISSNTILKINPADGYSQPTQFTVLRVEKDNIGSTPPGNTCVGTDSPCPGNGKGDGAGIAADPGDNVDLTADKDVGGNPLANDFTFLFNNAAGVTSPIIQSGGFSNIKFEAQRENVPDGRYVIYLQAQSTTLTPPITAYDKIVLVIGSQVPGFRER